MPLLCHRCSSCEQLGWALISSSCACCIDGLQILEEVCLFAALEILQELLIKLAFQCDLQSALDLLLGSADLSNDGAE